MAGENILFFVVVKFHWEPDCCPFVSGPTTYSVSGFTVLIPEELYLETFLGDMISVIYTQILLGFGDHPPLHPSFDFFFFAYFPPSQI